MWRLVLFNSDRHGTAPEPGVKRGKAEHLADGRGTFLVARDG